MVKTSKKNGNDLSRSISPKRQLSTSVSLAEIINNGIRFEASSYGIDVRKALVELKNGSFKLIQLYGRNGLISNCSSPIRTKRHYVEESNGLQFLTSSDIINLKAEARNYISKKLTKKLDEILIKRWDVLISRSGTIGNIGFAGKLMDGCALSEDALRLSASDKYTAGYVAAFLRSKYGRLQLAKAIYGSVITHIEPEHLESVLIPDIHPVRRASIGELFSNACEARDKANFLLDDADCLLKSTLDLPSLSTLEKRAKNKAVNIKKASQLNWRFEASYHDPVAEKILATLKRKKIRTTRLDDPALTNEVRAITRFRKRVYVEEGGIPLLSSKQLFQIDPIEVKKLAKGAHSKDIKEIGLVSNMIAVTCSGTIGRVQIIPSYMEGWTANQHAHRLIAKDDVTAGYLYSWLASDIGNILITRNSYGSVILECDKEMLSAVPVPIIDEKDKKKIGNLVLKANKLRDEAWALEQDAIKQIEDLISNPKIK